MSRASTCVSVASLPKIVERIKSMPDKLRAEFRVSFNEFFYENCSKSRQTSTTVSGSYKSVWCACSQHKQRNKRMLIYMLIYITDTFRSSDQTVVAWHKCPYLNGFCSSSSSIIIIRAASVLYWMIGFVRPSFCYDAANAKFSVPGCREIAQKIKWKQCSNDWWPKQPSETQYSSGSTIICVYCYWFSPHTCHQP